ncbi:MAG TPA: glucokinase [Sphingomicrobium sp.]|nr:glucokinase [Sphingomicrobium sp.]
MQVIVTADIGGTHARFALARLDGGRVTSLSEPVTLQTAGYATFPNAWREFERRSGGEMPRDLVIAFAGPVGGEMLKLTNNPWQIRREQIRDELGLEKLTIVNDFAAVAHAVAMCEASELHHLCGPDVPLPDKGVISIIGPGTGLGVAALVRKASEPYEVVETEGGHIDFAPVDPLEDRLLVELRGRFRRVSVERIISGPGLANIYDLLGLVEGQKLTIRDERALWAAAIEGSDALAVQALERFCLSFGSICGDLALAHGAVAVVIGGGVGLLLKDKIGQSGFRDRFVAKGRFERRMSEIPVKLLANKEAGLFGAAVAFAQEHCRRAG